MAFSYETAAHSIYHVLSGVISAFPSRSPRPPLSFCASISYPFQPRADATAEAERVARREAELALRASLAAESEAIDQRQRAADAEKRAAERQESARELAELRCRWLDDVERLVTAGDYRGALRVLMDEDTDIPQPDAPSSAAPAPAGAAVGEKALLDAASSSSPESLAWAMDMMFFRMVALSEYALTELEFNTPEQHGAIQRAFAESTRYLQGFKERREETREYVSQLQSRVFQRYCNELSVLGMQETILFHTGSSSMSPEEYCQWILQPDVQPYRQPVMSESQVSTVMGIREQVTTGFLFIMELKGDLDIPLLRSGAGELTDIQAAVSCVKTLSRSMLSGFDRGDFDLSVRLAGHLTSFVEENDSFLNMLDMAWQPFLAGSVADSSLMESSVVRNLRPLSVLVTKLAGPYRDLALQGWNRMGGVLADVAEQGNAVSFSWPALQDFITGALEGMTYASKHCCGGIGSKFICETLYDPVMITEVQLNAILFASHTLDSCEQALGKAFRKYMKNDMKKANNGKLHGALEEYLQNHYAELRIFRKTKYDRLRADLLSLYIAMGRVTEVYIGLSASGFTDMANCMYLKTRFESLYMVKLQLYMCIKILFGLESIRSSPVVPRFFCSWVCLRTTKRRISISGFATLKTATLSSLDEFALAPETLGPQLRRMHMIATHLTPK